MASPRGKNFGPPMTLANMRQNGVHAVIARCEACGHVADVNVDALAGTIIVPQVGRRLRCSECAVTSLLRSAAPNAKFAWSRGCRTLSRDHRRDGVRFPLRRSLGRPEARLRVPPTGLRGARPPRASAHS